MIQLEKYSNAVSPAYRPTSLRERRARRDLDKRMTDVLVDGLVAAAADEVKARLAAQKNRNIGDLTIDAVLTIDEAGRTANRITDPINHERAQRILDAGEAAISRTIRDYGRKA